MSNLENIKIGLISVLHTIVNEYEPEDNPNVDKLFITIMDYLVEEYDMTKEEVKEMIDNIKVEVIKKPKILN
jgi:hypothetical protein